MLNMYEFYIEKVEMIQKKFHFPRTVYNLNIDTIIY